MCREPFGQRFNGSSVDWYRQHPRQCMQAVHAGSRKSGLWVRADSTPDSNAACSQVACSGSEDTGGCFFFSAVCTSAACAAISCARINSTYSQWHIICRVSLFFFHWSRAMTCVVRLSHTWACTMHRTDPYVATASSSFTYSIHCSLG